MNNSSLDRLPLRDTEGHILTVIEATQGTRHKYKYDTAYGAFVLDGVLPLGLAFPGDFGFIPSTLGADGDPLDVLVLADESIPVGAVVPCRIVCAIESTQRDAGAKRARRNDRLIAVAEKSRRYAPCHDLPDVPDEVLKDIETFFVVYNRLKGGEFKLLGRGDARAAGRLLEQGRRKA